MTSNTELANADEEKILTTDPIATLLFLAFVASLGYLIIGYSFGIYPWAILLDQIWFIRSWDAVLTFLAILALMFTTLIGGLVRIRYSKVIVGIVTLIAVFFITYYAMLLYAYLITPIPP